MGYLVSFSYFPIVWKHTNFISLLKHSTNITDTYLQFPPCCYQDKVNMCIYLLKNRGLVLPQVGMPDLILTPQEMS